LKKELRAAGWRKVRTTQRGGHELWESHDGTERETASFKRKDMSATAVQSFRNKIANTAAAWEAHQAARADIDGVGGLVRAIERQRLGDNGNASNGSFEHVQVPNPVMPPSEFKKFLERKRVEAATHYIALPIGKGRVPWALARRLVDLAPEALWCKDEADCIEVAAMHYTDPNRRLRKIRRIDAQLASYSVANGWVDAPETGPLSPCVDKRALLGAKYDKSTRRWRIWTVRDHKPVGAHVGDRAGCLARMDAIAQERWPVGVIGPVPVDATLEAPPEGTENGVTVTDLQVNGNRAFLVGRFSAIPDGDRWVVRAETRGGFDHVGTRSTFGDACALCVELDNEDSGRNLALAKANRKNEAPPTRIAHVAPHKVAARALTDVELIAELQRRLGTQTDGFLGRYAISITERPVHLLTRHGRLSCSTNIALDGNALTVGPKELQALTCPECKTSAAYLDAVWAQGGAA
jgi:hypothetical protein